MEADLGLPVTHPTLLDPLSRCDQDMDCERCQTVEQLCAEERCEECIPCQDTNCLATCSMAFPCYEAPDACCIATEAVCDEPDCAGWDMASTAVCTLPDCDWPHYTTTEPWSQARYQQDLEQVKCRQSWDRMVPPQSLSDQGLLGVPSALDCTGCYDAHSLPSERSFSISTSDTTLSLDHNTASTIGSTDFVMAAAQDPFHCHWNSCNASFLDSRHFDEHFWYEHLQSLDCRVQSSQPALALPPPPREQQASSSTALSCAWDHCQMAQTTAPALFDHVKQDHVALEEHHRCKWLVTHDDGELRPCNACHKSAKLLTEHLTRNHIGTRHGSYECHWLDCDRHGRPFAQRQKILRHVAIHTDDRPHQCRVCGYACSDAALLTQHARTHTGERPYACSVCHKSFATSTALSVHMRTHTGVKPLRCKFPGCHKRFSESSNLAKHMRTHSSDRPFVCDFPNCGKTFLRADQRKRHEKTVHATTGVKEKRILVDDESSRAHGGDATQTSTGKR